MAPSRPKPNNLALFTDLYELTMAASYFDQKMFGPATLSLFIRKYPPNRGYFVSCGLADVLDYLSNFAFNADDLGYLEKAGNFSPDFLHYLENIRFTGDVHAIPEGRLFFKNEPILEIAAPVIEAQLVETFVINAIQLETMIATKASRCVYAARSRGLVDFSLRRTQGTDAGLKVARASYIAGFLGSSNVLAGKLYGIPIFGTMAHSYVTSFKDETEAFRAYARTFPDGTILLIDTYDTLQGARNAVKVGRELLAQGKNLRGVRLDSGDMAILSREVRKILKNGGIDTAILASGGFDEFKIAKVERENADIDFFGVGTKMGVSADAPYFDMAYKMVEHNNRPVLKLSPEKVTLAGRKQVFRFKDKEGNIDHDVIGLRDEEYPEAEKLLRSVMSEGKIINELPSVHDVRNVFSKEFKCLKEKYKSIEGPEEEFQTGLSNRLENLQKEVIQKVISKLNP